MKRTLTAIFGMTIATTLCAAENRTIAADADETISADATYATLTVLGKLTVDANTTVSVDTLAATNAAGEAAEIVLKEGARIAASGKWMMGGDGLFRVRFEGGTAAFTSLVRDGAGTNVFEGVDAPIRLELNGTGAAFAFASKTSRVLLTGNGGFERSGNKEQVINDGQFSESVLMDYSGDTVLKSGVYNHQGAAFPPTTDLKIEKNAVFVTFSVPFIVNSISGEGIVRDGGYNVPLTLNCESGDYEFDSFDTTVGIITKRGAGTVTLAPRNAFKSVDVKGGTLGIKSRQEAGFQGFQFVASAARSGNTLVFSEFYANDNAGKDILSRRTQPLDDWQKVLFDRDGGTDLWAGSPYTLTVFFGSLEQIASYNWRATWNSRNYDPVTWTMRGFVDYNNPRHIRVNLSSVENYAESVKAGSLASAKNFAVDPSVREVTADSLNVTYGAQLAVKGVTTFLPTSVKADGATFDLDEPARLVLGSTTDEEFNAVTLKGAGTFEKRGAGTLMLRSAKIATPISVKAGTLAFASGYAQTNTWFKFSILKNRWNVMGDKPDNTETQFSKIRFYDAANNAYSAGWNGSLYDSGWNLFADDNMADGCYSTSRPYEVIAKPTGSGIVAYRFADYTSGGSAVKTPAVWQVYAGNSEQGPWTLIDERQCMTTDGVRGWEAYNGGAYFYFTNRCSLTESAFTGTPKLELAHGTTLDVRETAAELADVTLDLSGDGAAAALRGGKLADTGVLNIVSEMRPDGATSLLSLDAVTLPADFSGWTVKWNGVAMRRCSLRTEGGVLKLLLQGLAIIVR